MKNNLFKTNRVIQCVDRVFIVDISDLKNIKEFKAILFYVYMFGSSKKYMYINEKYYKKIRGFLNKICSYNKNDFSYKNIYKTKWGDIKLVISDEILSTPHKEYNNFLVFINYE